MKKYNPVSKRGCSPIPDCDYLHEGERYREGETSPSLYPVHIYRFSKDN
ncbi:MAG: hypothetical protein JW931_04870 [Methanomicrobiaceae archaeon]|nr:hypothetical protein [Methanomicrobiaceae archaeon]